MTTNVAIITENYVSYSKEANLPVMSMQDQAEDVLTFAFETGIPLTDAELDLLVKSVQCEITFSMKLSEAA